MNWFMLHGVLAVLIVTPPLFLLALLGALFVRGGDGVHLVARYYCRIMIWLSFTRVKIEGQENILPNQSYVFAANHSSVFDIVVLLAYLPIQFRWLAKESLFKMPVWGWCMTWAGYIPLNRTNAREGLKSLNQAAEQIRNGKSVIVFPEGTRSDDGKIGEFKRGVFTLAAKAGQPIIPVAISGANRVMPARSLSLHPGKKIKVILCPAIPVKGKDRKEQVRLMAEVKKALVEKYDPDYGKASKKNNQEKI